MKNLITGTSTEVTWPQTAQVGAMSFLLGIQVQAEISPAIGNLQTSSSFEKQPYKAVLSAVPLVPPAQMLDPLPFQSHVHES